MINTTKTLTINGTSATQEGEPIASFYCSITSDGMVSKSSNIVNPSLYEANKETARADADEFEALCREIEDGGIN